MQRTGLNSGVVLGYQGGMGGGKTLSAVYECYQYYRNGMTVFSNIGLKFPHQPFTLNKFLEMTKDNNSMKNAVILIDEAHIWIDSRSSMSKRNKLISYLINQSRKRSIRILYTTQSFNLIEKRLRDRTDILTHCKKKTLNGVDYIIQESLIGVNEPQTKIRKRKLQAKPVYGLYDTDEIVSIEE